MTSMQPLSGVEVTCCISSLFVLPEVQASNGPSVRYAAPLFCLESQLLSGRDVSNTCVYVSACVLLGGDQSYLIVSQLPRCVLNFSLWLTLVQEQLLRCLIGKEIITSVSFILECQVIKIYLLVN